MFNFLGLIILRICQLVWWISKAIRAAKDRCKSFITKCRGSAAYKRIRGVVGAGCAILLSGFFIFKRKGKGDGKRKKSLPNDGDLVDCYHSSRSRNGRPAILDKIIDNVSE